MQKLKDGVIHYNNQRDTNHTILVRKIQGRSGYYHNSKNEDEIEGIMLGPV